MSRYYHYNTVLFIRIASETLINGLNTFSFYSLTRPGMGPLQKPLWTTSGPGYCFSGGGKVPPE